MIERAGPTDRAFLAMGSARVPEQFGVVLTLERSGTLEINRLRDLIADRIHAVPRLRQRLVRVPFGCGGPVWVDDPAFDIRTHVREMPCPAPGDEVALLDCALSVVRTPLPGSAPLWAAVLVTGLSTDGFALVVVLHHVLADGVGGLAVLAGIIDTPAEAPRADFPRPAPTHSELARDAANRRLRALRHSARSLCSLRRSVWAAGGWCPARAAHSMLNRRTGPHVRIAVVRVDLTDLRALAHRHGASVNDAVLVGVAAGLHDVLLAQGERLDPIVVTVPVSGRRAGSGDDLGNMVSPMLVQVPTSGTVTDRLRQVTAQVQDHRTAATGPPPIAVLGWLFRPLAAVGGFRWYMNHQRRFHTLVSHVRGPAERVAFDGLYVTSATPIAVGPGGNTPVYFEILSYANTLTITIAVDPETFPYLPELSAAIHKTLDSMTEPANTRTDGVARRAGQ
ncbi:wax ester/triacylglycerol synthase domain-containing protein [Nocardia wallacei]|uniref:wax ester/triacylglycerol synthase domain-containing protein n=1 Tax=Nocardia wallacei TaxID=480035 RepID=UPI0024581ACC|nr:wax ester/triacylglycerol synthase domain-containing protein [Nocardia wallacei]